MIARRRRRYNFARLNHILVPGSSAERDRMRRTRMGRFFKPFFWLYEMLTREGQLVMTLCGLYGAASLDVQNSDGHYLWGALTASLGCSLLAVRAFRLEGVRVEVSSPPRVFAHEDLHFTIALHNTHARDHHDIRVEGPFLPWDGRWTSELQGLPELPAGERVEVTLSARFSARGEHHLDPFRVSALVPLGLAMGPPLRSVGSRFVVVPRIARVEEVTTPLGQRHQPGGVPRVTQTGESMDLRGVRPYQPGDPVRDLHARSWARTGVPVVREYQQEYFRRVAVILDTDAAALDADAFESAVSLTAGLVARLSREDALVDLLILGHDAHDLTHLGSSLDATLDLLACVEPGTGFDVDAVMAPLEPWAPRLSSVLVVALAWDESREALVHRVSGLGVGCRAFVVTPADPRETVAVPPSVTEVAHATIQRGERLVL
jgi:uncharacterized protein (DUF58 family)